MVAYEETHWAASDREIAVFEKMYKETSREERLEIALKEVVIQLMRLNANTEEIGNVLNRIAEGLPFECK
ncbi:hypothetical protein RHODGE_RHODGE_02710 [Rhodoplanes serenus]|uniref:Uncharacterized protein n=1 Tax=Rhodoplanes serenus TaxID=200615 RepID=A0A447CUJ3_9BRAD|nr:hypothetical protein [Rhodoplanes serenus]VCU08951.1 hypothetical protein RHODGE_RHODGE_02710 [Rhodoplanes serenus]